MPALKRSTKILLISAIIIVALVYALILRLQQSDASTIKFAKELDAFIVRYCEGSSRVPSLGALQARFPHATNKGGWLFFSDARKYFKMEYPVKWWNKDAIGVRKLSKVTATPVAYVVEYRCGVTTK